MALQGSIRGERAQLLEGLGELRDRGFLRQRLLIVHDAGAVRPLVTLQNRADAFIKRLVVARTGEDLHDYVLFADRILAPEAHAGCQRRPLRAFSDSIDRADTPVS